MAYKYSNPKYFEQLWENESDRAERKMKDINFEQLLNDKKCRPIAEAIPKKRYLKEVFKEVFKDEKS